MRRLITYALPILFLCASCNKAEFVEVVHLGAVEKEFFLPSSTVEDTLTLITNTHYHVEIVEGEDWLALAGSGFIPLSRKEIPFRCEANRNFRRTAKVTLSAATRVDTVYIRQEGALEDKVTLIEDTFDVPAQGGTYTTEVICYRYPDNVLLDISAPNLITAKYSDKQLSITVGPATERDPKTYTVTAYYIDGWGERVTATATLNQKPRL